MENETTSERGQVLTKGLGAFSVGLGLTELIAPRALARLIGVEACGTTRAILRALGAREVAHGVGIFAKPRSVWTRLIGDLIDVAVVGIWMADDDNDRSRLLATMGALAGVGALDALATIRTLKGKLGEPFTAAITINHEPDQVYAHWHDFERLPQFMRYLESVSVLDSRRSHWVAKSPVGNLEWDAEITEDVPGRELAWRSVTKSMPMRGRATFSPAPGGRGTEMVLELQVPAVAKLFTLPEIHGDLRRFKQIVETGEVMVSDATSVRGLHPARPAPEGGVR